MANTTLLIVRLCVMAVFGCVLVVAMALLVWFEVEKMRTRRAEIELEKERLKYAVPRTEFSALHGE